MDEMGCWLGRPQDGGACNPLHILPFRSAALRNTLLFLKKSRTVGVSADHCQAALAHFLFEGSDSEGWIEQVGSTRLDVTHSKDQPPIHSQWSYNGVNNAVNVHMQREQPALFVISHLTSLFLGYVSGKRARLSRIAQRAHSLSFRKARSIY